jgi:hypothetical protein
MMPLDAAAVGEVAADPRATLIITCDGVSCGEIPPTVQAAITDSDASWDLRSELSPN